MIGIIDTGVGNIPSVISALNKINEDAILCNSKSHLDKIKKIILPGVGSFKAFNDKVS